VGDLGSRRRGRGRGGGRGVKEEGEERKEQEGGAPEGSFRGRGGQTRLPCPLQVTRRLRVVSREECGEGWLDVFAARRLGYWACLSGSRKSVLRSVLQIPGFDISYVLYVAARFSSWDSTLRTLSTRSWATLHESNCMMLHLTLGLYTGPCSHFRLSVSILCAQPHMVTRCAHLLTTGRCTGLELWRTTSSRNVTCAFSTAPPRKSKVNTQDSNFGFIAEFLSQQIDSPAQEQNAYHASTSLPSDRRSLSAMKGQILAARPLWRATPIDIS
jgi:hypothetical protein